MANTKPKSGYVWATTLFDAMSNEERWAYWADECSLSDIFTNPAPLTVRRQVAELVNAWVQSNPSP